jgi:4-amino-4-deoxy-L-arabinose transferase-like glycosyltransferase
MPRKAGTILSTGLLLVLFLIQGIFFVRANSPTYDEAMHLAAGYSYLATGDFRLEPQNPPLIKVLLALPLFLGYGLPFNPDPQQWRDGTEFFIGQDFLYRSTLPADHMLIVSRLPNLLLGGLLAMLTGWWAYRLWGNRAALLAMALASFEPNLVAHSSLVTTDIGVTLFIFFCSLSSMGISESAHVGASGGNRHFNRHGPGLEILRRTAHPNSRSDHCLIPLNRP